MKLNAQGLLDRKQWEDKGYQLPHFDRAAVTAATKENPFWIHFGAGNIFRAFQAAAAQKLLNEGIMKSGIIAVDGFDYEIVEKAYRPNDNLSVLVHYLGRCTDCSHHDCHNVCYCLFHDLMNVLSTIKLLR